MTWLTWALLLAFFAALTAILAKLGVAGLAANVATAIRTSVVVVFTWLIAYAMRQPASFQAFSGKTWLFLVLSGLATGLSWLCYFRALKPARHRSWPPSISSVWRASSCGAPSSYGSG